MSDEGSTAAGAGAGEPAYAYPAELARFVRNRWNEMPVQAGGSHALPKEETLEHFFSACYQASLLREEERLVTFRAIFAAPPLFTADGMPPQSVQRLAFSRSFPFDASELRRLSVASDAQRTLIGVQCDENGLLQIWGLLNSGTRWLRDVQGGRRAGAPLPPAPVVHVDAPGRMAVYRGYELIAKLQSGRLSGSRADPFVSEWLPDQFRCFRDELMARHDTAVKRAIDRGEQWAVLEPTLPRTVSERMMKRVIAMLRDARHGGTIVFVPPVENASATCTDDPYIDLKYRFGGGEPQRSFPDLVVSILNRLAQVYGLDRGRRKPVGWEEFETTTDDELEDLDEALFETAHLIAGLASVDGAVVMTKQHDLLGFGGMISGKLPPVRSVAKALDLEGNRIEEEGTESVGSRHRSSYRLAGALPGVVVVVISQDGGVRFVSQKAGRVTYWEQE